MGKSTGFMDYAREDDQTLDPRLRVNSYGWFHESLSDVRRQKQGGRCMDCGVPFCQADIVFGKRALGCPLHNLIPEWNDMLWRGNLEQALARLLKTNCFPEFTGRVCPALCEQACTCGQVGAPVTIRDNELAIIEHAFAHGLIRAQAPKSRSGKTVAVVGSGPAGLTVASLLNQRGHLVSVFEREQRAGGLLTYGIPNMKLPKDIVERRVGLLEAEGIVFETGVDIGRTLTVDELCARFDCVVLACGAQKAREVPYEGSAEGVHFALEYLGSSTRVLLGELKQSEGISARNANVVVVGAGDSASDCIATALRQGCRDCIQLIRRPATDYPETLDYAHEEALAVLGHDIRRFETRLKAVEAAPDGKLASVIVTGSADDERIDADLVIMASGFTGTEPSVWNSSEAGPRENIFLAGDMVQGATLVARAIADGRAVAREAESFLIGYSNID